MVVSRRDASGLHVVLTLGDALFGTSDLDRGVVGTLFNGASEAHVRRDLRAERPPVEFYPAEDQPGRRTA
jgi:hypothetical protein